MLNIANLVAETPVFGAKLYLFLEPSYISETAYRARTDEDFRGEGKGQKVECSKCGKELAVGSLAGDIAKQHDIYQSFAMEVE